MANQTKLGWRSYSPVTTSSVTTAASLLTSLYSVWNGDISANSLENNLYVVYNGDNDATDMISNRSGNPVNGANYTTGKLGQAFNFDGVNDYISLPNNTLNLTGDFSISFWYYTNVINSEKYLISNWNSNTANGHINGTGFIVPMSTSNKIGITIYNTGFTSVLSNTSLSINTWYHVTITRKSATNTKIYINGSLDATGTSVKDTVYNPVTFSSSIGNTVGVGGGYVNGRIDGLSFWTRELSAADVTQLYNSGNGLQYPFTKDTTIASPKNQLGVENGVLMNGTSFSTGKIGNAFTFDGVNDYVALPDNSVNVTGDFSISGWVYIPNGYIGTNNIYILNNVSANAWYNNPNGYALTTYGNSIQFDILNNTNNFRTLTYNVVMPTNNWYHIVATRKSGVGSKIYLNGTMVASDTNTIDPTYLATISKPCIGALNIPARGSVGYFAPANTKIDAVSLWKKELTQADVTELYNSGTGKQLTLTPIVTDNLLFNLDVDRPGSYPGTGATWSDNSGNGNNGTIVPAVIVPNSIGTNGAAYWSTGVKHFSFNNVDGAYGSNSYLKIPLSTTIDTNGYTFGGWVKNTTTDTVTRISKGADGIYGGWAMTLSISNTGVSALLCNSFSQSPSLSATYTITLNNWYYVVCRYNHKSELKLYVNGVAVATLAQATPITNANEISMRNSPGWVVGAMATNSTSKSTIATFHAYNRVLADAEILQNFDATKANYGY